MSSRINPIRLLTHSFKSRRQLRLSRQAEPSALQGLLAVLALGFFWYCIEFLHSATSDPAFDFEIAIAHFSRLLPMQLLLFGLLGVAIAALLSIQRANWSLLTAIAVCGATFLFLAPAVGLGVFRKSRSEVLSVFAIAVTTTGLLLAALLLAQGRRLLPTRLRRNWPLALAAGASSFLVPLLRETSAPLSLGTLPQNLTDIIGFHDFLAAFFIAGAILLLGILRNRRPPAAGLLLMLLFLAIPADGALSSPNSHGGSHPDVIVILVDTLRADHVGPRNDRASLTPNLDLIAGESVRFHRAIAPSNFTFGSLPAIMTGFSDEVVGRQLAPESMTLAEYLNDAGYSTYGFSANPLISKFYGYDQGFDSLYDPATAPDYLITNLLRIAGRIFSATTYRLGLVSANLYYPPIDELRKRAIAALHHSRRPRFIYIQTMEPHGPYLPPKKYLSSDYRQANFYSYFDFVNLSGRNILHTGSFQPRLENLRQRYRAEVRFTDAEIGRFVDALRSASLWDDSLVWILSDHGEAFGEDDRAGHSGPSLSPAMLRVPLILKPPRALAIGPRDVQDAVSTADLLPTTLSILGLAVPAYLAGRSLLELATDGRPPNQPACAEVNLRAERMLACIRWPWKLDLRISRSPVFTVLEKHLYNLDSDPDQGHDLATAQPDVVETLTEFARQRIALQRQVHIDHPAAPLPAQVRERLRNLGYLQ